MDMNTTYIVYVKDLFHFGFVMWGQNAGSNERMSWFEKGSESMREEDYERKVSIYILHYFLYLNSNYFIMN